MSEPDPGPDTGPDPGPAPDPDAASRGAARVGYTVVIPTRWRASRFPGKPLHPLNGRAMVLHTLDRARESGASEVVVATDDARIEAVCRAAGADVQMTASTHENGTRRIAEVAERRGWEDARVIVGLQGDEPATPPGWLDRLAANLASRPDADMATLCTAVTDEATYLDPMRVKVVTDATGMALYFSRAPVPHRRDARSDGGFPESWLHVGIYAYRRGYLARYGALESSPAEREEMLEQLRVLHHGGRVHVDAVPAGTAHGVDRPEDVPAVERVLRDLAERTAGGREGA